MRKLLLTTVAIVLIGGSANAGSVKCNDPAVIAAFKDAYVCNLINCKTLGVKTYAELQALDDDQIKQRYDESPTIMSLNKQVAVAGNQVVTEILQDTANQALVGLTAAKHVITSVDAVPTDYNQAIKKYTCEAEMTFDQESLRAVTYYLTYLNRFNSEQGHLLMVGAASKNSMELYHLFLTMQVAPMAATVLSDVNTTLTFTVQAADIDKADDPNFILRSNLANGWVHQ